jgi:hypothetical protein
MKPADRNLLGGLFGDFQQGYKFGSDVVDTNRRRKMENEQFKQEQALVPVRLAQAKVAAERAQYDLRNAPEEFKLKQSEAQLRRDELAHRVGEYTNRPAEKTRDFIRKAAGEFNTTQNQLWLDAQSPEWLQSDEGLAEVERRRALEARLLNKEDVDKHGQKDRITTNESVRAKELGADYNASLIHIKSNMSKDANKTANSIERNLKDAVDPNKAAGRRASLRAAKNAAVVVKQHATANPQDPQSQNDIQAMDMYLQLIDAEERKQAISPQPAAQPQQPYGPPPPPVQQRVAPATDYGRYKMSDEELRAKLAAARKKEAEAAASGGGMAQ